MQCQSQNYKAYFEFTTNTASSIALRRCDRTITRSTNDNTKQNHQPERRRRCDPRLPPRERARVRPPPSRSPRSRSPPPVNGDEQQTHQTEFGAYGGGGGRFRFGDDWRRNRLRGINYRIHSLSTMTIDVMRTLMSVERDEAK